MSLIFFGLGFGLLMGGGIFLLFILPAIRENRENRKGDDDS